MPTYDYECQACEHAFELVMKMSEYSSDVKPPCPECGVEERTIRLFTPPMINFSGDGWATKNGRVTRQMQKKNQHLASKERDMKRDGMVPSLTPNVGGEQTSSWADAAKLAKSKGKDTSGYDKRARKEKVNSV